MNIKQIISLSALISLTGASCWGADDRSLLVDALNMAMKGDESELRDILAEGRIDINMPIDDGGNTMLMRETFYNNEKIVDLLLLNLGGNLNVNAVNNIGQTALSTALNRSYDHLAQKLINNGAEPRSANETKEIINLGLSLGVLSQEEQRQINALPRELQKKVRAQFNPYDENTLPYGAKPKSMQPKKREQLKCGNCNLL